MKYPLLVITASLLTIACPSSFAIAGGGPGGGDAHNNTTGGTGGDRSRARAAIVRACTPDAQRFCSAVLRDATARAACMQQHRAELSAACTEARRSVGL